MYTSFYNLGKMPFQISSDPSFIWLGEKHKEALATLRYGILDNKGFLLLTGDVGTGKTTLINTLISSLSSEVIYASVPDPRLEQIDFFNYVTLAFGIKKEFSSKGKFIIYLSEFLHNAHRLGKKALLIIDESQLLSQELLEEIRLLSNINVENSQILNIFFVGQNEFNEVIAREENRAVSNRLTLNYQLSPLTLDETGMYIHHRLLVSGASYKIFGQSAVEEIFLYSGGLPRRINVICDHCLLTGYVSEQKTISAADVKKSVKELSVPQYTPSQDIRSDKQQTDPSTRVVSGDSDSPLLPKSTLGRSTLQLANFFLLILVIVLLLVLVPERFPSFDWVTFGRKSSDNKEHPVDSMQFQNIIEKQQQVASAEPAESIQSQHVETDAGTDNASPRKEQGLPQSFAQPDQDFDDTAKEHDTFNETVQNGDDLYSQTEQTAPVDLVESLATSPGLPVVKEKETGGTDVVDIPGLLIIRFAGNAIGFESLGHKEIGAFIDYLMKNPLAVLLVTGHTDSRGSAVLNYRLSLYRAEMVKSFFLGKGVPASQIQVEGHGPDFPMASNDTVEGRTMNRRVEVKLL